MSLQHAQQYIATLYDYDCGNWSTPESAYARKYLDHITGERKRRYPNTKHPPKEPLAIGAEFIRKRIHEELDR